MSAYRYLDFACGPRFLCQRFTPDGERCPQAEEIDMGKDKGRKAEGRHVQRKQDEAVRSFLGSAKEENDRRAARGEGWHEPRE